MSENNKPDNPSQNSNGHPLLNALSQFGRSFFLQLDPYPDATPQTPPKVITIWERLQLCEDEKRDHHRNKASKTGLLVRRIEPKEPIDFLEYCRRRN